jgi:hypothetical protein
MSSTMMMERTGMGLPGMGLPGLGTPTLGSPAGVASSGNYLMVPRCTLKFEKCTGGMKVHCVCEDKMACSMMQNLCTMLQGGLCSCSVMLNGMTVCHCHFTMGLCKCDMTDKGVLLTCTSGDSKCCEMIQAYCDCLSCLMNAGCTCCLLMNNTPVACGCCELPAGAKAPTPAKK